MAAILNAFTEIFGIINEESPSFKVISKTPDYEIRQYQPQIRATYTYPSDTLDASSGFRHVAGYIFGDNTSRDGGRKREEVAMTVPVVMEEHTRGGTTTTSAPPVAMVESRSQGGMVTMSFIMPSKYSSIEDLPIPNDPNVQLVTVPARKVAVKLFSWRLSDEVGKSKVAELRDQCARGGVKLATDDDAIEYNQYNPPWTIPFLRTNEVSIPVLEEEQNNVIHE